MPIRYQVLVVGDSTEDALRLVRELQRGALDLDFQRVETADRMQAALEAQPWDFILCESRLQRLNAQTALAICQRRGLEIPFIMLSDSLEDQRAVQMLKAGVHDCVPRQNLARLLPAVNRELRAAYERQIRRQTQSAEALLASTARSCNHALLGLALDGTVVTWNAGAQRLYGYASSEMIGRSVSVLIPAYHPEGLSRMLERLARGQKLEPARTVHVGKDGAPVAVSLVAAAIRDARERIIGAAAAVRDIMECKPDHDEHFLWVRDLATVRPPSRRASVSPCVSPHS